MIRDSSDEEDEDEQEEEEEPIDFAAEAAKTAARSLARSASSSYLKALFPKCQEAVGDAEIQAKQLAALDELVARHPEMANKRRPAVAPIATPSPAMPSPAVQAVALESPSHTADGSPTSAQSVSPASPMSPMSPASPDVASGAPKKAAQRGARAEPTSPKSPKSPKSPASPKVSPKRQVRKANSAAGDAESKDPSNNQAQSMKAFTEMTSTKEVTTVTAELPKKASPKNTWSSSGLKASASSTGRFETTMRPAPKANSASLTQLPSGTWRGPVETSGNEREMFLRSLSKHESMPLLTFRPRRGKDLWVTNVSNPAPGTYPDLDESHTSKYLAPRQVSFGFSRKSSRWPANADQKPGPGAHSVVNFERFKYADPVRHSFGAAARGRPNPIRQSGPGPGAYGIQRSADEEGPAVTMVGKYRKRGVLNYDEPGPGAYEPTMVLCGPSAPSVGFATSLRQDFYPKEDKGVPAPGTYDVMKQNPGADCLAFSMAGKRKRHDLTAHLYAGPGPGFYNHGSTFGYRSTWQAPLAPPLPWAPPLANGAPHEVKG